MDKRTINLMKNYKTITRAELQSGINYIKRRLAEVKRSIDFDERYHNRFHLLTNKAIQRDKLKNYIFELEDELKRRRGIIRSVA